MVSSAVQRCLTVVLLLLSGAGASTIHRNGAWRGGGARPGRFYLAVGEVLKAKA